MIKKDEFSAIRESVPHLPPYWIKITNGAGIQSQIQLRDWQLVLSSAKIPYFLTNSSQQRHLYTPPLLAGLARAEIGKFLLENGKPGEASSEWIPAENANRILLFLVPLIFIHLLNAGFLQIPHFFLPAGFLAEKGCLDKTEITFHHQWYRIFTALTLHADIKHLSGNLFLGGLFLFLLARMTGPGSALLLTLLGGAFGNAASLLVHTLNYKSIGFSTAIFASLGLMAGIMSFIGRSPRTSLLSLGGILGLFALLGTEGNNTDYGAHLMGLFSGFFLGLAYKCGNFSFLKNQFLAAFLGMALVSLAWICAFL